MNLFIIALPSEIEFACTKQQTFLDKTFYTISPNNILVFSDVGKVNAAYTTLLALTQFPKIKNVFNLGTCGTDKFIKIFDILNVQLTQFVDVDLSAFEDYEINQYPREEKRFYTYSNYFNNLNVLLGDEFNVVPACIGTSDVFITKENINKYDELKYCQGYDMECAAIAMICKRLNVNFNAIKIVSDNTRNPLNSEQFTENLDTIKQMM